MKKMLFLFALIIAAGFIACENPNDQARNTYTVSFDANGGAGGPDQVTVTLGEALPALAPADKPSKGTDIFTGYYDEKSGGNQYYDNNLDPAVEMWNITEHTTLYAQWETGYIITFNANGGNGGPADAIAAYGRALPLLNPEDKPVNAGQYFTGYYDAETDGTLYYNSELAAEDMTWDKTEDTTLYARWSVIPLTTISFHANGGSGTMPAQQIPENTNANLTANTFTRTGHNFSGWAESDEGAVTKTDGASYTAVEGEQTLDLYAVWTAKTYSINFEANGGSGGQSGTVTATYGQPMPAITMAPDPAEGTQFNGYWDERAGGTQYYTDTLESAKLWDKDVTGAVTLYAQFIPIPAVAPTESVVSLVQSTTVTSAANFTYEEILAMTREAIELAGGLEDIVKSGDVVVLKPNVIVTGWNWGAPSPTNHIPELVSGICTDRRVVRAVAQIVREITGPFIPATGKGKIMVIEGSGSGNTETNYANIGYTLDNLGYVDELIALDREGSWSSAGSAAASMDYVTQVTLDDYVYKGATGTYLNYYKNDGKYWVNKKMLEADVLICIPVVKNHWNAAVTGAIKNISIGAAPPRIYGQTGSNVGRNNMVNHASSLLHDWIADYFACIPADFVVMDGLQGLANGPEPPVSNASALATYQKNLRCMLASKDSLAIDTVEANIVGWDYTSIPYMTKLNARGQVGPKPNGRIIPLRGDPKDIVVLGNKKVDEVRGVYQGAMNAGSVGAQIKEADRVAPTVSITSAEFSGANLNLALNLSTGTNNNVVKIDVYVDGNYKKSFNTDMTSVSFNASGLAGGQHTIEVRAFTKYMYCATATTTATK